MRSFKNIDYFRKAAPEHTKATVIGGIISLMSLFSIVMLFFFELSVYTKPNIQKDTIIAQDPHQGQYVLMNIDIEFPNAPCYLIDIDVESAIQAKYNEQDRQELIESKYDSSGQPSSMQDPDMSDVSSAVDKIAEELRIGNRCRIHGKIHLQRGTGKINFSFNSKVRYLEDLRSRYPAEGEKLRLTHVLKSLTFGEVSQHIHILLRFDNSDHTNFDMMQLVDDSIYAKADRHMDYFYFLKLVPHIFVDETTQSEFRSYSYSLNHNSKQSQNDLGLISMIYDFTPVNMKITKKERDLPRFLVNLCAIVGGVFVIYGLLNRLLLQISESVSGTLIK